MILNKSLNHITEVLVHVQKLTFRVSKRKFTQQNPLCKFVEIITWILKVHYFFLILDTCSSSSVLGCGAHDNIQEKGAPCVWSGYPVASTGFGSATLTHSCPARKPQEGAAGDVTTHLNIGWSTDIGKPFFFKIYRVKPFCCRYWISLCEKKHSHEKCLYPSTNLSYCPRCKLTKWIKFNAIDC